MTARCAVGECSRPVIARNWCGAHYRRWHRYGDPEALAPRKPVKLAGDAKDCRSCGRTLDRAEFPQGWSPDSHFSKGKACATCSKPLTNNNVTGLCSPHLGERRRGQSKVKRLRVTGGYVALTGHWDHPNARTRGHILEHVKVMSEILGRPLFDGENVHHLNGVRDDNRPENLELWVVKQPQGQRPADLVAWAKEILERYDQPERMSMVRGAR